MFTKLLIPLDGSRTSESALPYARYLASSLKIPAELITVIDIAALAAQISAKQASNLDRLVEQSIRSIENYLREMAGTFSDVEASYTVEKGRPEDVIIQRAAADKSTLIHMATHGHSGIGRWLLGSVSEKVLRGAVNPLMLVRATEEKRTEGEAVLRSVLVPLDGSKVAERILPVVIDLAKRLELAVILFRAYHIPYTAFAGDDVFAAYNLNEMLAALREEAIEYLEQKTREVMGQGVMKVSCLAMEGLAADEIIAAAHTTPDSFIAMCTHGRSGVKRWVLGSVTEVVVRHAKEPVLTIRAE